MSIKVIKHPVSIDPKPTPSVSIPFVWRNRQSGRVYLRYGVMSDLLLQAEDIYGYRGGTVIVTGISDDAAWEMRTPAPEGFIIVNGPA